MSKQKTEKCGQCTFFVTDRRIGDMAIHIGHCRALPTRTIDESEKHTDDFAIKRAANDPACRFYEPIA